VAVLFAEVGGGGDSRMAMSVSFFSIGTFSMTPFC
jgi:hypothetical protein